MVTSHADNYLSSFVFLNSLLLQTLCLYIVPLTCWLLRKSLVLLKFTKYPFLHNRDHYKLDLLLVYQYPISHTGDLFCTLTYSQCTCMPSYILGITFLPLPTLIVHVCLHTYWGSLFYLCLLSLYMYAFLHTGDHFLPLPTLIVHVCLLTYWGSLFYLYLLSLYKYAFIHTGDHFFTFTYSHCTCMPSYILGITFFTFAYSHCTCMPSYILGITFLPLPTLIVHVCLLTYWGSLFYLYLLSLYMYAFLHTGITL